jgi:hypothetical protein
MIKIRVFWDIDDEIDTALRVTNAIDSIIEGKQRELGVKRLGQRTTNDPLHSFGINIEMQRGEDVGKNISRRSSHVS